MAIPATTIPIAIILVVIVFLSSGSSITLNIDELNIVLYKNTKMGRVPISAETTDIGPELMANRLHATAKPP